MNYIIREYRESDYDQVVKIMSHAFNDRFKHPFDYNDDELTEFFSDIEFFPKKPVEGYFVAESDDQILGAINLNWRELKQKTEFLDLIELRKKYSKRKLFKTFLATLALIEVPEKGECYIEAIAITDQARRQGIASSLLKKADEFALHKGFKKLSLHVSASNKAAEELYKSQGFRTRKYYSSRVLKWLLNESSFKFMTKKPGDNPEKLTIGMFTDTYMPQINGVATSIHVLTKELEKMGHTVYIITINDSTLHSEYDGKILRIPGMKVLKGTDYRLANLLIPERIDKIIEDMHLDIVHSHTEFSIGLLGTYIARKSKIAQIHTYHTMYDDFIHYVTNFKTTERVATGVMKVYVREFADACQKIIVPTEKTRKVLEDYKVETPLTTIPTGLDFSKFMIKRDDPHTHELRTKLGLKEDDFVCLNIGRMSKEKNTRAIVEAVKKIVPTNPHIKFLIIGDGPEYKSLLKDTEAYRDNIKLLGKVPWEEIAYYYQLGDTFITASRFETQGLTVIEALSSEVPVICADDKAFIEIVKDDYNGLLFSSDEDISDCILKMQDKDYYDSLLDQTRDSVIRYSSEYFAETVLSEYIDTIKSKDNH
ncbi:GNAT family N-acetyltransferase [Acidaminobacter sp. JC074]|uniref:GNAT family N-acetyltransferase n=1 Tax=Acidaminobacter sp. JC074 TaxID=2530199 RepID=UPI001F0E69D3|nr:GNAT family N-acetyltransferase [Acidaminobacter sp. JC074]